MLRECQIHRTTTILFTQKFGFSLAPLCTLNDDSRERERKKMLPFFKRREILTHWRQHDDWMNVLNEIRFCVTDTMRVRAERIAAQNRTRNENDKEEIKTKWISTYGRARHMWIVCRLPNERLNERTSERMTMTTTTPTPVADATHISFGCTHAARAADYLMHSPYRRSESR